ncbi:OLC1v1013396C1 [Oldenlandia corymbosa var. corymbosa]|uniref:OLC1v1013396C1 n=2 Tax=Oldenlandia corymbosa var. corymbosa TaxID=529605 RepID=A0AAV1E098_OLDCO|nr:OLC1v1013396C1 [Oldenlandia corymbosa var. corymbosa]
MGSICNKTIFLLLLCFLLIITQIQLGHAQNAGCIARERRALVDFKGSLVDNASRLSSWTGENCCDWDGVTCNNLTGRVEKLDLHTDDIKFESDNCVGGQIDPSILKLEHLRYLDLSLNCFSGITIPTFLGSMKNLRYLNLKDAGFSGEIPPQLGNLSALQYLYIGEASSEMVDNSLSSKTLGWITRLTSLNSLDLSTTNLSECLDWLDMVNLLPSLSYLNLSNCELVDPVHSPLFRSNLTSLVSLDIGTNTLESASIPRLFDLSSNLEVLRLESNQFQGPIFFKLEKFTSLSFLDYSGNSFNSSDKLNSLCNLTSLMYVDLSYNQLEGSLPVCLGNLTSLRVFNLGNNNFSGTIPSQLGHLKELTYLCLSSNTINSSIPSEFGNFTEMETLLLDGNQLFGAIPPTLGQLTKLQTLDLSSNSLVGEVSEIHFTKLRSLKSLALSRNQLLTLNVSAQWIPPFQLVHIGMDSVFIGTEFPQWLRTQRNVEWLYMNNANISGTIPEWFSTVYSVLTDLDLSDNMIHGTLISIPPGVVNIEMSRNSLTGFFGNANYYNTANSSIQSLSLDGNIVGEIPDQLCNLTSLTSLFLSNNHLTGKIPPCFENLQQLSALHLSGNKFNGELPSVLKTLKLLWELDLSGNNFTGNIPEWIGEELSELSTLYLQSNNFNGAIPSSFKNLKLLASLDLTRNHLTGTLPDWIGEELPDLYSLRLQSNKFYGALPSSLKNLKSLVNLDLSKNEFSGTIPDWIGKLSDLSLLILQVNNFHGELPATMKNLKYLTTLHLGWNQFTGTIPEWIGEELPELLELRLQSNNFSGNIPVQLCKSPLLRQLALANNSLTGYIPDCFAN